MGVDHYIKAFQLADGSIINCYIYDTAGQERYNALTLSYYKNADAILLVYDIANKNSFAKIKNFYVEKIKDSCKKNIPILLLGNKTDLEDKRQVTKEEGIQLAVEEHYEFKESSCVQNSNVAGAFEALVERWNVLMHTDPEFRNSMLERKPQMEVKTPMGKNNDFSENQITRTISTKSIFLDNNQQRKRKKNHCCKKSEKTE